jgi:hypothetical protein
VKAYWENTPFDISEPQRVTAERNAKIGKLTNATLPKAEPSMLTRGKAPTAAKRHKEPWEEVVLSQVTVDLSAMDFRWTVGKELMAKIGSGKCRIYRVGNKPTLLNTVEWPTASLHVSVGSETEAEISNLNSMAGQQHRRDAKKHETPHWNFTTQLGNGISATHLYTSHSLMRDPFFVTYSDPSDGPALGDGRPAIMIIDGWEGDRAPLDAIWDTGTVMILTTTNLGFTGERSIDLSTEKFKIMPSDSWVTGNKDACNSRKHWSLRISPFMQDMQAQTRVNTEDRFDRWSLQNRSASLRAYLLAQGGGQYLETDESTAVLACSDGSLDEATGQMGYGVAFRNAIWNQKGPTSIRDEPIISSLLPEADAATAAARIAPKDRPFFLGIDSATLLYHVRGATRAEFRPQWFRKAGMSHIGDFILALSERVSPSILFKVNAHTGFYLNEEADKLADEGRADGDRDNEYRGISFYANGLTRPLHRAKGIVKLADAAKATTMLGAKTTKLAKFLTMPDMGIELLGGVLKQRSPTTYRHWMQAVLGVSPTQGYLYRIGICASPKCLLCDSDHENLAHVQCGCSHPSLKRTRIAVHHHIREAASRVIFTELEKGHGGWEHLPETAARHLGLPEPTLEGEEEEDFQSKRPDCTLRNCVLKKMVLLEFSRAWDQDPGVLEQRTTTKSNQYAPLVILLRSALPDWEISTIALIVGVRGTSRKDLLQRDLSFLDEAAVTRIQIAMAREACSGLTDIMQSRSTALRDLSGSDVGTGNRANRNRDGT